MDLKDRWIRRMDGELKHQVPYQGNSSPIGVITECWYNFIRKEWIMQRIGLDGFDGECMNGSGRCLDGMKETEYARGMLSRSTLAHVAEDVR